MKRHPCAQQNPMEITLHELETARDKVRFGRNVSR
jgi:hypothetical protein